MNTITTDARILVARIQIGLKKGTIDLNKARSTIQYLSVKANENGWDGAFEVFSQAYNKLQ